MNWEVFRIGWLAVGSAAVIVGFLVFWGWFLLDVLQVPGWVFMTSTMLLFVLGLTFGLALVVE